MTIFPKNQRVSDQKEIYMYIYIYKIINISGINFINLPKYFF